MLSSQPQQASPWVSGCCTESPDSPSSQHINMHELISPCPKRPLRTGPSNAHSAYRRQGFQETWSGLVLGLQGNRRFPRTRESVSRGNPSKTAAVGGGGGGSGTFNPPGNRVEAAGSESPLGLSRLWFLCSPHSGGVWARSLPSPPGVPGRSWEGVS